MRFTVLASSLAIFLSASLSLAHPGHEELVAPPRHVKPSTQPSIETPAETFDVADLAKCTVSIEIKDGFRVITSNGIPDHVPGEFPNRGNPNSISEQKYAFRVPAEPKFADKLTSANGHPFGIAVNGVVFDPGTAEAWKNDRSTGWMLEAFGGPMNLGVDKHNAHVQPNGAYHYHALPIGLYERLAGGPKEKKVVLVGWAADGFPIYGTFGYEKADDATSAVRLLKSSWQLKKEDRVGGDQGPGGKPDGRYTRDWEYIAGSGDLDECNGRTGVTPEFPKGTYYYVITDDFPYISRSYKGTPDASFERRGPGGGRPGPRL